MSNFNRFGNMSPPEEIMRRSYLMAEDPFHMVGNVYFVGNTWCSSHLIDTGDGLILLDTPCLPELAYLLDGIWRLGFDPRQIKYIIVSHAHVDQDVYKRQISISAMMGTGLVNTVIAISISSIGEFARITRASVLSVRDQEYVEAVKAISAGNGRIIFKHILPNIMAPLIVQYSLKIAASILAAAGLSFVGLGVQPPTPEWGAMLSAGRSLIRYNWWLTLFPGLAIMITVYGFNLFGDGMRDALDPRLKD